MHFVWNSTGFRLSPSWAFRTRVFHTYLYLPHIVLCPVAQLESYSKLTLVCCVSVCVVCSARQESNPPLWPIPSVPPGPRAAGPVLIFRAGAQLCPAWHSPHIYLHVALTFSIFNQVFTGFLFCHRMGNRRFVFLALVKVCIEACLVLSCELKENPGRVSLFELFLVTFLVWKQAFMILNICPPLHLTACFWDRSDRSARTLQRCWGAGWVMRRTEISPWGQGPGHRFMALIIKVWRLEKLIQDRGLV